MIPNVLNNQRQRRRRRKGYGGRRPRHDIDKDIISEGRTPRTRMLLIGLTTAFSIMLISVIIQTNRYQLVDPPFSIVPVVLLLTLVMSAYCTARI